MSAANCPPWCDMAPGHGDFHSGMRLAISSTTRTSVSAFSLPPGEVRVMVHWEADGGLPLSPEDALKLARMLDWLGHTDVAETIRRGVELIGATEVTS